MKISVVTPSFNQAPYLERTLDSIHGQTGDFELEHIVMDGGSADGSVDILRRWDGRLDWVSEKDGGQTDALNKGFAKATGEILTWLNSDDLYLPGALETAARTFRERPDVSWICGGCIIVDEQGVEIRRAVTAYKNFRLRHLSFDQLLVENPISQPATFFRRSLFDQAGPLDAALHYVMDYELWLRFMRIAPPAILSSNLAAFRFHRGAKTGGAFEKSLREAHAVARRYAEESGKPYLSWLNYWAYFQRTMWAYRILQGLGL